MKQYSIKPFLQALAFCVQGSIYVPEDEGYAPEISAYNTAIVHTPEAVVGASSATDIAETVRLARQYGYAVAVQSTGHGAQEPLSSGVILSTRRLDQVHIDPETCIATIAAGVKWNRVIAEAAKHGLAPVAGASTSVGVVGYLLGGGLGPLARSHGFSSDYITRFTVVTNGGKLVEASAAKNPDLFWALRGGKLGLGIVTEVQLRLIQLKSLYAGSLFFEEKDIEAALSAWADWTAQADPRVTTSVAIILFPAVSAIPEKFRGRRLLSLRFAYPGPVEEGVRLAAPLRACAPVYLDALGELPASEMGRIHNDPTDPMPFWASTVLLDRMDQGFVTHVLEEFGADKHTPFCAMEIRHIGAATHCDVKEGSAVGGRSAKFAFSLVGKNPKQFEDVFSMKRDGLFDAMRSWISEEGNINLMGSSIQGKHFKRLWPADILKRLGEVQRKYESNSFIKEPGSQPQ